MADPLSEQILESRVQGAIQHFLTVRSPWLATIENAFRNVQPQPRIALFGGLIRDLAIFGEKALPRDVDLVVSGMDSENLAARLGPYLLRPTRFGGLQLLVEGVEIDIWPLKSTWAFRAMGVLEPSWADLPKTTFLNIEAIAAEVTLFKPNVSGSLYERGFFDAIVSHTLEINYEDNPYPAICVARSLDLASRLGFAIGPRLSQYILFWLDRLGDVELRAAHQAAHGTSRCPNCLFQAWEEAIRLTPSGMPVLSPSLPTDTKLPVVAG